MSGAGLTSGQRLVVLLLVIAVIVVFSMFAGFIITTMRAPAPAATLSPTSAPPTSTTVPTPVPTSVPPTVPEEGIWSQVQAARLLDQIERRVEGLRGLSPLAEVPLNFLDAREMTTMLRRLHVERGPEAQLLPYVYLDLLPGAAVDVEVRQVAGVYVPEQKQLYVVTDQQGIDADEQALLLAHAYAHALQDQHFDLGLVQARANTTDARLAVQALVEGDAVLLTALYRYEDLEAAKWLSLTDLVVRVEQPGLGDDTDASEVWERVQRFPYWQGRQFAASLFQAGGWERLDRAYVDPPRSTEQVLHPERYLGQEPDRPTDVLVPDLGTVLGEGWTMRLEDTLGEYVAGLYLAETLSEEMAWEAVDGWDGDTFVVWERADGDRVRVWRSVWDSTTEAAEFEEALVALVPQRYLPAWPVVAPRGLPGQWWKIEPGAVCVYRVGRYVAFVQASGVDTLGDVVDALP